VQGNIVTNGIFLAGMGLALSFVNIAWTATYSSSANKLSAAVASGSEVRACGASVCVCTCACGRTSRRRKTWQRVTTVELRLAALAPCPCACIGSLLPRSGRLR